MRRVFRVAAWVTIVYLVTRGLLTGAHASPQEAAPDAKGSVGAPSWAAHPAIKFAGVLPQEKGSPAVPQKEAAALSEVFPRAAYFEAVKDGPDTRYYLAFDHSRKKIGAVFTCKGQGYADVIETQVGMSLDGTLEAVKVVSQNETPGVGMRVTEESFTDQFRHTKADSLSGVQAITGATISSRAVMESVKIRAGEILPLLKDAQ